MIRALLYFFITACLAGASTGSPAAQEPILKAKDLLHNLPIRFEPNQGQWNPQIRFAARADAYSLILTDRQAVLSLGGRTVSLSMLHSKASPNIRGLDPLPSRSNYFLGNKKENWRTGVAQYSRVRYQGVYPGIDVVYYGNRDRLEYDFVLQPGADPRHIRMNFKGADRLAVTKEGDLLLEAGGAQLIQKKPVIYQRDGREVNGEYKLLGRNTVGVELERYDRSQPLTIDPVLVYSTLLGGTGNDTVTAVKLDQSGLLYVTGSITGNPVTTPDGAYQATNGGNANAFLAVFNPTQTGAASLVYFTYIGGNGVDVANAMALDGSGFVYLTGSTTSSNFPLAGPIPQSALAGGQDAFVTKINPTLQGQDAVYYSTYLGGTDLDIGYGIDADASGAIYVTGTTKSVDFPITANAYQSVTWGPQDAFMAKIIPSLGTSLVYSSYLGGELSDEGRGIAVAPSGAVYMAGTTSSTQFPYAGAPYRATSQGSYDIFIAQVDFNKVGVDSLVYSTYLGGSGIDELRRMAIDSNGKLWLTGYTLSSDFPLTGDALQSKSGGNGDAFVTEFDPAAQGDAVIAYSTYIGGAHSDVGYDIFPDSQGNIYLTGYTLSADFPVTGDALIATPQGGIEIFLVKLNPKAGGLLYSTYIGKTGVNSGYAVTAAKDGTIYLGGDTAGDHVPVTDGAVQTDFGGGVSDGFVMILK